MLKDHPFFQSDAGPAASDLCAINITFLSNPGPVNFDLGVIAGDRSYFSTSENALPGADDGKAPMENMKLESIRDIIVIHNNHKGLTENREAMQQVEFFLLHGEFYHDNHQTLF